MSMKEEIAKRIAEEVCRLYGTLNARVNPSRAEPLTRAQNDVLNVVIEYRSSHGISPTYAEIGEELGIGKVAVCGHVSELERKGWIFRASKHASRSIVLIEAGSKRGTAKLRELAAAYSIVS